MILKDLKKAARICHAKNDYKIRHLSDIYDSFSSPSCHRPVVIFHAVLDPRILRIRLFSSPAPEIY